MFLSEVFLWGLTIMAKKKVKKEQKTEEQKKEQKTA